MLHAHAARPARRQGGMAAAARLDAGLLIGADDVLVLTQGLAIDDALVQIQHSGGLGPKRRVTREDPGVVAPRPDGILGQPAAQRRGRHVIDQPAGDDRLAQLGKAPPAERGATGGGQLAGDRLDLSHDRRREPSRPAWPLAVSQPFHALLDVAFTPLGGGVRRDLQLAGDPGVGPPRRGQQHDPGPGDLPLLGGWLAHQRLEPPALRRPEHDLKRAAPAAATSCHRTRSLLRTPCWSPPDRAAGYGTPLGGIGEDSPAPPTIPDSTESCMTARSCPSAGCGTPAQPAGGALRSTSPAAMATRTRCCPAASTPAPPRRRWTAPAGSTSTTPPTAWQQPPPPASS